MGEQREKFRRLFKRARQAHQHTMAQVSDALGVSRNIPYRWEEGENLPSPRMYERVAAYMSVSFTELEELINHERSSRHG